MVEFMFSLELICFIFEFLDLSCEAGPSAQLLSQWIFLIEFLLSLKNDDFILTSWTCLANWAFGQVVFLKGLLC